MLGYVTIEKPELKVREFDVYNGYYCGICKSIGKRYGQAGRLVLSYDAAFLAILLAALDDASDVPVRQHCIVHPVKRKTVIINDAVDYAADVMLILAWHKLADDVHDEGKTGAKIAMKLNKRTYDRLEKKHQELCDDVREGIEKLRKVEESKSSSLDMAAEPFAEIMKSVLTRYDFEKNDALLKKCEETDPSKSDNTHKNKKILAGIGYHLGKWIYLIDAWDDIDDNIKTGSYNPLVYRYKFDSNTETVVEFRNRIREDCRRNLLLYLSHMASAADLLPLRKNSGIIENIVYMGLLRKTETLLMLPEKPEKNKSEKL